MHDKREQTVGEGFILAHTVIASGFPIVTNFATKLMPPIFFGALAGLAAAAFCFIYLLFTMPVRELFNRRAWPYILGVTAFIVFFPTILINLGTSMTSGINTTILLQTEILFTFVFCALFFGEKITTAKLAGAFFIVMGSLLILFKGSFDLGVGALLIALATAFYPFGNWMAKRALAVTKPVVVLFYRNFLGGLALLAVALFFEKNVSASAVSPILWKMVLIDGMLIFGFSKILWYEGLRRLDLSKAVALGSVYPAFSLIYAYLFLKEIPDIHQGVGFVLSFVGVYILTRKIGIKPQEIE